MKFAVITNKKRDCDLSVTEDIVSYLSSLDAECAICSSPENLTKIISDCDAVVTVGGDGTILGIAQIAAENECPVVGVNKGSLGYLAELEPDEITALSRLVSGDYHTENRMMLKASLETEGVSREFYALNDIVVTHDSVLKLTEFDLSCDGMAIAHYRADGLIFSTPTGSTAYSLSAGGPVVDPTLRSTLVTPICAHTLTARPVLFNDETVLSVTAYSRDGGPCRLYADGGEGFSVPDKTKVTVSRSLFTLKIIRFGTNPFYNILSKKIH